MSRFHSQSRQAFSLLELLLVTAVLGLVAATIAATISGGLRVWENARNFNASTMNASLGLDLLARDVRNTGRFFAIPFEGETTQISFPRWERAGMESVPGMQTVRYTYDSRRRVLTRASWPYPEKRPAAAATEVLVSDVRDFRLSYLAAEGEDGPAPQWGGNWMDPTNLPARVRVECRILEGREEKTLVEEILVRGRGKEL